MSTKDFFKVQKLSSKIKASIVSEYFPKYCNIIMKAGQSEIRYVDLFAGPGIYEDGNPSTPILIGKHCRTNTSLKSIVKFLFNDHLYKGELEANFKKEFEDGTFPKGVHFGDLSVGDSDKIKNYLVRNTHDAVINKNKYPSLLFIDPFGYKGIETNVFAEFLKNWGNEIFLFVNTKRIHPALENDKFDNLMRDWFPTTLEQVKKDRRYTQSVTERLSLIINSIGAEYEKKLGEKIYYTAFRFQEEDSDATSHYILHLTKHSKGFELVKQVYNDFANVGTVFDGNNTYTFDSKSYNNSAVDLFDPNELNIDLLKGIILKAYKGKHISALSLFNQLQKENLYSKSHYAIALRKLHEEGKVSSTYTDNIDHEKSIIIIEACKLQFN